jgi:hypothetical protein
MFDNNLLIVAIWRIFTQRTWSLVVLDSGSLYNGRMHGKTLGRNKQDWLKKEAVIQRGSLRLLFLLYISGRPSLLKIIGRAPNTVPTLENFPFCPADAAIVANIPLADIGMIYWLSPYLLLVHNNRFFILNEVTFNNFQNYDYLFIKLKD